MFSLSVYVLHTVARHFNCPPVFRGNIPVSVEVEVYVSVTVLSVVVVVTWRVVVSVSVTGAAVEVSVTEVVVVASGRVTVDVASAVAVWIGLTGLGPKTVTQLTSLLAAAVAARVPIRSTLRTERILEYLGGTLALW